MTVRELRSTKRRVLFRAFRPCRPPHHSPSAPFQEPPVPPALDDPLFPAHLWQPLPRPAGGVAPTPILRRDDARHDADGADGPQLLRREGERALVRFRHTAKAANAVALQVNGWWRPAPSDACELRPLGDGRWEGVVDVPADWRASYGVVEHHGTGEPPWRSAGMRAPGAPVVPDPSNPRGHRAGRGGALRSLVTLPDDGPFTPGATGVDGPGPEVRTLAAPAHGPRTRWWASRPGDPGCEELAAETPLPLLILTDGAQHVEHLHTPALLARGVAAGVLPPLAAVFLDSGPRRGEVLGVPGGHARWIAEQLVPGLRAQGLGTGPGRVRITAEASHTIVAGSSFGGLTALFAAARAPQLIGAVIAQSVSLWRYPDGALVEPLRRAAARSAAPLRLRLHVGRFEGDMPARSRALHDALVAGTGPGAANGSAADAELRTGADAVGGAGDVGAAPEVSLALHSGGHDWAWWQPTMLHELAALLR